jgi:hypothetical protein
MIDTVEGEFDVVLNLAPITATSTGAVALTR